MYIPRAQSSKTLGDTMILVYDTETTGLLKPGNPLLPGIIQIGAVLLDAKGKEVDAYNTRVNPELEAELWEKGAIKVTGIGPNDVEPDWPTFFEVFPAFADFAARATVMSGYNILKYDDDVLFNQLVRYGFEKHFPWPRLRLDVMPMAKLHKSPGKANWKLTEIYEELFGEKFNAHDALDDVRATARVLVEIGLDRMAALL